MRNSQKTRAQASQSYGPNRKRKYNSSFLEYGFTSVLKNEEERPRCLLCGVVLCSEGLEPSKLKRHFQTKHKDYQGKPLTFFEKKLEQLETQGEKLVKYASTSDTVLRHTRFHTRLPRQ